MIRQKQLNYVLVGLLSIASASTLMGASVQQVENTIKNNDRVVLMFTRSSCPYCTYLKPKFNQLKKSAAGVTFKIIPVTTQLKNKYKFSTVPTVIYFKNGKEVGRHGSNNGKMTVAKMQNYLNKTK